MAQRIRMEEEKIEAVKDWPELQSVLDIQVFLSFPNFYRKFIRNLCGIVATLTLMLRITGDESQSTQAENQDIPVAAGRADGGRRIKNLSTIAKLTKSKKSNLSKANFAKLNSSKINFLIPEAKKAFIHL